MASSRRCRRTLLFWVVYIAGVVGVVGGAAAGYALAWVTLDAITRLGGILLLIILWAPILAVSIALGTLIGGLSAALLGTLCVRLAASRCDDTGD